MEYLKEELNDDRFAPPLLLKQLVRAGRLGKRPVRAFMTTKARKRRRQRNEISVPAM